MEFMRKDLFYKDYSWVATSGDDPKKTVLDSKFFNRGEGYEVLSILNHMIKELKISKKENVIELEKYIREELPSEVRGTQNVVSHLKTFYERKRINLLKSYLQ